MFNPFLIGSLKRCDTGERVDAVFDKYRVSDFGKRIEYLLRCQGNPKVFYAGGAKPVDAEELFSRYLTVRSMFITGSWR